MPAKINSDMPLPMPRSVICSPSHMMNADPVVSVSMVISTNARAGIVDEVARLFKADGNAERLHRAQNHGQIARPLGDLLPAHLAFLLQLRQWLIDHGEQLQNDGGRDVRHDAERKNRQAAQVAAAEQVDETEHGAAVLLEKLRQLGRC